jgi:hypothetical protein
MMPPPIRERLFFWFGREAVRILEDFGLRIVILEDGQKYSDVSAAIAADPYEHDDLVRGCYLSSERAIYLRNTSEGTIVHEVLHALVDARGPRLATDPVLAGAYAGASGFVSSYARNSGDVDEWMAENVRFLLRAPNGDYEIASPKILEEADPRAYDLTIATLERLCSPALAAAA